MPEHPLRTFCRISSYALMAMGAILMLAAALPYGVGFIRDYRWLLQPQISFHESWTPQERQAILALERDIRFRHSPLSSCLPEVWEAVSSLEIAHCMARDKAMASYGPQLEKRLRTVCATGSCVEERKGEAAGSFQPFGTLAMVAARMGNKEALYAFVRHGCPVSDIFTLSDGYGNTGKNCLLSLTLAGTMPDKLEIADWLVGQGAEVVPITSYYKLLWDDDSVVKDWLFAHGLPLAPMQEAEPGGNPVWVYLMKDHNLPLIKKLVDEGKLDVNACHNTTTPLKEAAYWNEPQLVYYLLGKGADPNGAAGEESPLLASLENLYIGEEDALALVRLLLLYGADPVKGPEMSAPMQQQVRDIYRAYGYTYETEPEHADKEDDDENDE